MRPAGMLLAVCALAVLINGCAGTSQYKVLSFFFDGVPNPEEQAAKATMLREQQAVVVPRGSIHGPYAAKMCGECHQRQVNSLILPVKELCFKCHKISFTRKWVHGPLASGGCFICHYPHTSSNPFLLRGTSGNICFYCHDEKLIREKEQHKNVDIPCTSCHDAHSSDKQYLLL